MGLKATVFKAQVQITDMDRDYGETHSLTLARQLSETDEWVMVRILTFCLFAGERLAFTKGLSSDEEADLWQFSLSGEIELWIEVGQPDERRLCKARGRARQVVVLTHGRRGADLWWQQNTTALGRLTNVRVLDLLGDRFAALVGLAERTMYLECTTDGGGLWIGKGRVTVELAPAARQG